MTPSLDIVIVSYNTRDDLVRCLASLQAAPPEHLGTVFVVDNASTDGSVEAARQQPGVRVLALDANVGFGAANNRALCESSASLVLLLNSDTIVPAGAIDRLRERLVATDAVAAGPRLIDGRGRPEVSFGPMLSPLGEWRQRRWVRKAASDDPRDQREVARLVGEERVVDWVSGACLLLKREAAATVGFFDERYFMYEEDVDLCAALRAAGGRIIFTPAAEIQHLRGRSVQRAGPARSRHYDDSHVRFYEKHRPAWAGWLRLWLRLRGRSVR
jgi:N-acetylglucosaminyl-diphospho-decaprenol L-rhamnosyltransferase